MRSPGFDGGFGVIKMTDFAVWINMTAPYKSGKGRRTVWRGRARVEAVNSEQALRSQSFESIGKTYIHGESKAICVLGAGWEVHLHCPGERKHCKVCGSLDGEPSNFCRDCTVRPGADISGTGDELASKTERVATNRIRTVSAQSDRTKARPGRKTKRRRLKQAEIPMDLDITDLVDAF